jgi:hypothetical protein
VRSEQHRRRTRGQHAADQHDGPPQPVEVRFLFAHGPQRVTQRQEGGGDVEAEGGVPPAQRKLVQRVVPVPAAAGAGHSEQAVDPAGHLGAAGNGLGHHGLVAQIAGRPRRATAGRHDLVGEYCALLRVQ